MLKFDVKISEASLAAIKAAVEAKARDVMEDTAVKIFNKIVTGSEGADYPLYSGSYIASWTIQSGSPNTSYKQPYWNKNLYDAPDPVLGVSGAEKVNTIYVSNYVPHAGTVELDGTPTHPSPWMQAHYAVNDVVASVFANIY